MKIAIFGAGGPGKYLCDEVLKRNNEFQVMGFLDNYEKGEYNQIKIYEPDAYFKLLGDQTDAVIVTAGAQKTLRLMVNTCRKYHCKDIYMLHDIAGKNKLPLFDEKGLIPVRVRKIEFSEKAPTIAYFEVPITDNCNLNCKGCLFASNMTKDEQHISLSEIKRDAERMSALFYDIPWIRILGGEPLMHPDIIEILQCYRKCFPDSEIDLCTNGLLIPKMDEKFWDCLRKERISIHVSGYKPTYHLLEKIDSILKANGLQYVILKRDEFVKYYMDKPVNDMKKSFEKCIASGCYEVYKGKISSCSAVIAFEKFNEKFGTQYSVQENEDWFDIHKPETDAWKIAEALGKESNICKYCSDSKMESFPWDYSSQEISLEDYLI